MSQRPAIPTNRYAAYTAVAVIGLAADLGTKHVMFAWPLLQQGGVYWIIPGFAGFQDSLNEGALFGMGQGGQFWFALLSLAAAVAIPVWLFAMGGAREWWTTLTLGGITGGVLGNLYDRAGLHGLVWGRPWPCPPHHRPGEPIYAVRDWILLQAGDAWRWPNFNIADALLVVGAGIIFLQAFRTPEGDAPNASTNDPEAT